MSDTHHWSSVYARKSPNEVTWYQPHLQQSLDWIHGLDLPATASIVDVGGGAATLVDDLLEAGHAGVTVLDWAAEALERSKARLGDRAALARWIVGDVTDPLLELGSVDLWHDRAVFHFFVEPERRAAYIAQLRRALKPGGYALIATFAHDGPERCSGLPVRRYDADEIHAALGEGFDKISEGRELHEAPWGGTQSFTYCLCRRRAGAS